MHQTHRFLTPLRYPGGKGKFSPFIKEIININSLNGDYIEPYAGGAGIAIDLLLNQFVKNIYINDIDPAIYFFWKSILYNTDEFMKKITDTNINMEEWYKQKALLESHDTSNELDYGFAAFFLNRTNRSGILKGGVIGGKQQRGKYLLSDRFNKTNLIRRIENIAKYSERIKIYNLDALDFLSQIKSNVLKDSLVYLDPPYYVKGQGLYRNFYSHEDHCNIEQFLHTYPIRWLVSYDNCPPIKLIYKNYRQKEYILNYSAQIKSKASEILIFDDRLKM